MHVCICILMLDHNYVNINNYYCVCNYHYLNITDQGSATILQGRAGIACCACPYIHFKGHV